PERAVELVRQLVNERIPQRFGFSPRTDIQVLTPMHRGAAGTVMLNALLQQDINPDGRALRREETIFRVGDKVLQLKNDYNKEVFNGDLGEIVRVDEETPSVTVRFEADSLQGYGDSPNDQKGSREVTYEKADMG